MGNRIFLPTIYIVILITNYTEYTKSRNLNKRDNYYKQNGVNSDDLLANPGLLEQLTKSQLENLLADIERDENGTSSVSNNNANGNSDNNSPFTFDDIILQDLFSQSSSKEDLQTLSDMFNNDASINDITNERNSTNELEGTNTQTQSQSQNVSIITNIYKQGAGGQHHHRHYHLLLLSDDGQAQGM